MTSKLDLLKQAFSTKASSSQENSTKFFRFWSAEDDTTTVFRFLPDADDANPMGFLVENIIHEIYVNGEKKRIPCLKMYGEATCPCCTHSQELYAKAKECEAVGDLAGKAKWESEGKKYYRKISYIGQGIVLESPIEHDQDQLVKLIDFGPQVFKVIQAAFKSGDLEKEPYDFFEGYNFRIRKERTGDGKNSTYTTSSFAPKQTALDESVIAQIDLQDLKNFRQRQMSRAEVETLLLAAKTGGSVNTVTSSNENSSVPTPAVETSSREAPTNTVEASTPAPSGTVSNSAVLQQLRERAKARAAQAEE